MTVKYYYRSYTNGSYINQLLATVESGSDGLATTQIPGNDITGVNLQDTSLEFIAVVEDVTPAHTSITMTSIDPITTNISATTTITADIPASQLPSTQIPVTVHLETNDILLPTQYNISDATIQIKYFDGSDTILVDTVTTDEYGNASTTLTGLTAGVGAIAQLQIQHLAENTIYANNTTNIHLNIIEDRNVETSLTLSKSAPVSARNKIQYTTYSLTVKLKDTNNVGLRNEPIVFTLPSGETRTITTSSGGVAELSFTPNTSYIDENNNIPVIVEYPGHPWDGTQGYQPTSRTAKYQITADEAFTTILNISTTLTTDTINSEDLPNTQIPVTVHLETNDSILPVQEQIKQQNIQLFYYNGTNETLLTTLTTDNTGTSSTIINGLPATTATRIEIRAKYAGQTGTYTSSTDTLIFQVTQPVTPVVDPLADADFYNISNWGTYPSGTSGASHTGATTAATTTDLTIDATAKTITDKNTKYMVYNKTLQDFLNYYGDEFSLIAYKTGGDGRFALGFVNTTTRGYKLYFGGDSGNSKFANEEANSAVTISSPSDGWPLYQKYNEFTFKKVGSELHLYYKVAGTTYTEKTIQYGNIDPSKYYLYFHSSVRAGLTITNDRTKIQNTSRP
jgi:hypothetical protein